MLTETPFRPREKLLEKQKIFQSIQRHTYLKGPMDKITSVAIPLALAASSLYMISGYERLCCLRCIQPRDHNYGTTCVCRVPKHLHEEKVVECVHCGCQGCASGD